MAEKDIPFEITPIDNKRTAVNSSKKRFKKIIIIIEVLHAVLGFLYHFYLSIKEKKALQILKKV